MWKKEKSLIILSFSLSSSPTTCKFKIWINSLKQSIPSNELKLMSILVIDGNWDNWEIEFPSIKIKEILINIESINLIADF